MNLFWVSFTDILSHLTLQLRREAALGPLVVDPLDPAYDLSVGPEGYAADEIDGGPLLEFRIGHWLAEVDLAVQRVADLVLDGVDVAVLVQDDPLQHVEHHAVLVQPEGVAVHGAASQAGPCSVVNLSLH